MRALSLAIAAVMLFSCLGFAANAVYIGQAAAGANDGTSCANEKIYTYFNTAGNWSATPSGIQIGPDTTVHLCGTFTSGNASNILQFQGSGTSGHPIIVLFETGAIFKPNYCASNGCIDLNGNSFITINGGSQCGVTGYQTHTACNGLIQDQTIGSTGATCPSGSACTTLSGSTSVAGIGTSTGSPSTILVENLECSLYTRLSSDTTDSGMGTTCIGWGGGTISQGITVDHVDFHGAGKLYVISLGNPSNTTLTGYTVTNSYLHDQCWAMGVGQGSTPIVGYNINGLVFQNNEVTNWDNWAPANVSGNVCHTNGTMWFNGNGAGYVSPANTGICGSGCLVGNNYLHGNLAGNAAGSSPSGYLSCQDNCYGGTWYNNVIIDTSSGTDGGGGIYFNGPGGGGQIVANNTIVRPCCSMMVATGTTANVIYKDNIMKCTNTNCVAIEIRPNTPDVVTSDFNIGYQIGSSSWAAYNSAAGSTFLSLASWQARGANHDNNSLTSNPNLTATYSLAAGSPAIACCTNLTSLGISALDSDILGIARPSSAAWDAGAFVGQSLSFNPGSLTYNPQPLSTTSSGQTVTITNVSASTVTLTSEVLQTGTNYAISANTCGASLAASANCVVTITFTPLSAGTLTDNLVVTSSGIGSPQSIAITGIGLATPVISPPTGTYSGAQTVTITDSTAGVTIYYTNDGSTPDATKTLYSGAFTVSTTQTIKAIAILSGVSSGINTSVITITGTNNNLTTTVNHVVVNNVLIN
jgi:hypothetical protein